MPDDLYHRDIVGWSAAQADRLRRLSRGERVNDLDWENLIEEVESVGRSELKSVRSLVRRALEHALKIHMLPGSPSALHWRQEMDTFWRDARLGMDPGMTQHLDFADLYADAREAVLSWELPGATRRPPESISLSPADLRNRAFGPGDLLARIAAGA